MLPTICFIGGKGALVKAVVVVVMYYTHILWVLDLQIKK